jgi:uncharacterized protein with PIN domain
MPQAGEAIVVRCHGALNDFLPPARRDEPVTVAFASHETIKHVVEAVGVPHPEIEALLVQGQAVDFGYRVQAGDKIDVYPAGDVPPAVPLRPPLPALRFVLDVHLGRLAAYLRMLGFDALYSNRGDDLDLARVAGAEQRVLLTRDLGLLKRRAVVYGAFVRATEPEAQLHEMAERFELRHAAAPFQRCIGCNGRTVPIDKAAIIDQLQPKTRRYFHAFWQCQACGRIYWQGSHVARMQAVIDRVFEGDRAEL